MYPIWIQLEAGKWARPLFYGLGIIYGIKKDGSRFHTGFINSGSRKVGAPTFYMDWVLYMVLKKMTLIFILVSPILKLCDEYWIVAVLRYV